MTSLYTNFYVKKYWHELVLRNRKQHIITEILGLSPARMRIWQQRLLAEAATGGALLKKVVLRNFEKFTGKRLCQSLFFSKVVGPQLYSKRDSGTGVFLRSLQEHLYYRTPRNDCFCTWRSNFVVYSLFTCHVNFPVWRHYLGCQCDVLNVKTFH